MSGVATDILVQVPQTLRRLAAERDSSVEKLAEAEGKATRLELAVDLADRMERKGLLPSDLSLQEKISHVQENYGTEAELRDAIRLVELAAVDGTGVKLAHTGPSVGGSESEDEGGGIGLYRRLGIA